MAYQQFVSITSTPNGILYAITSLGAIYQGRTTGHAGQIAWVQATPVGQSPDKHIEIRRKRKCIHATDYRTSDGKLCVTTCSNTTNSMMGECKYESVEDCAHHFIREDGEE